MDPSSGQQAGRVLTDPRRWRWLVPTLLAAATVLLAVAVSIPLGDVQDSHGAICGSAWRASQRETVHGGERSPEQVRAAQDDCQAAGDDALAQVPWFVAASGVVAAVGMAVRFAQRRVGAAG